jgi:5-methylcytosine-specific restriction enzyme A
VPVTVTAAGPRLSPIDVVLPRCAFCHAPFTTLDDAWLEFYDGPTLRYPHDPETLIGVLAHTRCGPDAGYTIALPRLLADGVADEPRSWFHHLSRKRWFGSDAATVLDMAHAFAQKLARGARDAARQQTPVKTIVRPPRPLTLTRSAPAPRTDGTRHPRNVSTATRARIMERDDFRCRRCGASPRDCRLVVDHIVPVARGGSSEDDNLQTLCEDCNQGKAARPPHPHDMELR